MKIKSEIKTVIQEIFPLSKLQGSDIGKPKKEKTIAQLVRENIELRDQLQALSKKLNEVLDSRPSQKRRIKLGGKMGSPKHILEIANRQLKHYESEQRGLEMRLETISKPDYVLNLQASIEKMTEQIEKLTSANAKIKVVKSKFDKKIDDKTKEIKELSDFYDEMQALQKQKTTFEGLIGDKNKLLGEIRENLQKLDRKNKDLEEDYLKFSNTAKTFRSNLYNGRYKSVESQFSKSQKIITQTKRYNNTIVANLEIQLRKLQATEVSLIRRYEKSYEVLKDHQKELTSFKSLESSPALKDLVSSISPDLHVSARMSPLPNNF